MKLNQFFSWTWIVFIYACFCAEMEAKEDPIISSVRQTRMLKDLDLNSDGPKFWYEKLTTEEIKKAYGNDAAKKILNSEDSPQAILRLETKGIRHGDRYTLYTVNAILNKTFVAEFIANREGQLETVKDGVPLSGYLIMQFDLMNGEQVYYVLVSANKKTYLTTQIILDPIEFLWADKAYVTVMLLSADANSFTLIGKGFRPNEELVMTSRSGVETIKMDTKANSEGCWCSMLLPAVVGSKGGKASLVIERRHSTEIGELSYLWGDAAKTKRRKKM